jgi:hypothetical protein
MTAVKLKGLEESGDELLEPLPSNLPEGIEEVHSG